ncbi:MAG: crossover junction endodeoxyribonuclease RuvC [Candidatus Eremiobacteraeota bacterium]|nr:crossover junction endodeoxyribonuclease RuvC [Candidatus Eremiobacteraeota bacterium]
MTLRVLGVDPGLRVTGYAAIESAGRGLRLIEAGIVEPDPKGSLEVRLLALHRGLADAVAATQPHVVVIEELFSNYKNPLTAVMMGHARGVLCLAAAQHRVVVRSLGHSHVKRALTGSGAARKEQVKAMVTHLLGLRRAPEPDDLSDALALAVAFVNIREHEARVPGALSIVRARRRRVQ